MDMEVNYKGNGTRCEYFFLFSSPFYVLDLIQM